MKRATSSFGQALRLVRTARGMPQEVFHPVSGRTYVSVLERGLKQPTITKIDELAEVLGVHPLSIIALSYCQSKPEREVPKLLARIQAEVEQLLAVHAAE